MPRRTKNTVVAELEGKIENHVASRIRLRRGLLGMSQSDLARALGITFQQVQKYERGSNRVSVGKLYRLAEILDVPLTFFFDDLDGGADRPAPTTFSAPDEGSPLLSRRDLDLLRAWRNAPADIADCVAGLLRAVSQDDDGVVAVAAAPAAPAADEEDANGETKPTRRRRGAVWDPADMYKAAKAPKRGKSAPTPP
ncbi:helix-turn-helix transcriptional regulator [Nitrospirillum sp. BR 11163]|uniref:helix-turn-helix domain-containing protein n=1 Tax=Nitrospirillum sp. BR 11163 TaxID=3104323 RepID=UPI002B002CA1|nr:helix-turn-helix transcriptional regulator [Nitrospirillum sp. BR 11163]MEA1676261.1 helix-turn-helix transcriptional regulator [Nitrospirillum sp. BR 11163]